MARRAFLIVLDSFGIGGMPDEAKFGDEGSNTLRTIYGSKMFSAPTLTEMGMFNIKDNNYAPVAQKPIGSFARLMEASNGKDTTIGHWEIAGVESAEALPVYPNGFPQEIIAAYEKATGRAVLCNKAYSGTQVLEDFGEQHMQTGALIVYTSADSVFQVAAHEEVVPLEELYRYCQIAREMLSVGRVIARPFTGKNKSDFKRTANRHDYSLKPPKKTMLDYLMAAGKQTIGVGKIYDIFDGEGVSQTFKITSNAHGMQVTDEVVKMDFDGLAFINLVDFDMLFGHRNNIDGYANAATEFDTWLAKFLPKMQSDDILIITADHGCDPGTPSTDHSRECVPMLIYGAGIKQGVDLGVRRSFADIAQTVCEFLGVKADIDGESFYKAVAK